MAFGDLSKVLPCIPKNMTYAEWEMGKDIPIKGKVKKVQKIQWYPLAQEQLALLTDSMRLRKRVALVRAGHNPFMGYVMAIELEDGSGGKYNVLVKEKHESETMPLFLDLSRRSVYEEVDHYLRLPYTYEIVPDKECGYFIRVKELPGCMSQGDTPDDAMRMIQDAMTLWIEGAMTDGDVIPLPTD